MSKLAVSIVQFNISWKEKQTNFKRIQEMLIGTEAELVVLPELFQTGFCIDDMSVAETMEGPTVSWMCAYSRMHKNAICGSFLCQDSDLVFNRFVLVSEGEIVGHYDKTHLFGLDGEQEYISAGSSKVDMVVKGFKIRPMSVMTSGSHTHRLMIQTMTFCSTWLIGRVNALLIGIRCYRRELLRIKFLYWGAIESESRTDIFIRDTALLMILRVCKWFIL